MQRISWDLALENLTSTVPDDAGDLAILAALEQQLAALDGRGARVAAAYLDAAIQQFRADLARR